MLKKKLFGSTTAMILALVMLSGVAFGAALYIYKLKASQNAKTSLRNIPLTVTTTSGNIETMMPGDIVAVAIEKGADSKSGSGIFKIDYDPVTTKLPKYMKITAATAPDVLNYDKLMLRNPATGALESPIGKTLDQVKGWTSQSLNTSTPTGNNLKITLTYEFIDPAANISEVITNPQCTINYSMDYTDN